MARSLTRQVLHYLSRPHGGVPLTSVASPADWLGADMATRTDEWADALDAADVEEIVDATRAQSAVVHSRRDVAMPRLAARVERWRDELANGRGFVLIRGIPVDQWSPDEATRFFWSLGLLLGVPGMQNESGDLVGHVIDRAATEDARLYQTSKTIRYHCDAADVVGLLCLKTAREGGLSRIASSVAIYNRLVAEEPELARLLFEPFALDTHGQRGLDAIPVPPCRFSAGVLRTFYHADYFRSGGRKAGSLSSERERLLDRYDAIAESPEVRLDMELRKGDIQFVSNHSVVHARTGYVDHDEPSQRRHLLRLWLSLEGGYRGADRVRAAAERARLLLRMAGAHVNARRKRGS